MQMKKEWPKVRLGEVLTRNEESIALEPDTTYREITVRLWGKGVVLRGVVTGA
jgi:type I restriction enzyme S subunit